LRRGIGIVYSTMVQPDVPGARDTRGGKDGEYN
jgi:hypothetical protein